MEAATTPAQTIGTPTLIHPGHRLTDPATTRWAVSAVILGIFMALLRLALPLLSAGLVATDTQYHYLATHHYHPVPISPAPQLFRMVHLVLPYLFILGGIAILRRREWGRRLLAGAAALACVSAIHGGIVNAIGASHLLQYEMATSVPGAPKDFAMAMSGVFLGASVLALIQVGYYAILLRHLRSPHARRAMRH